MRVLIHGINFHPESAGVGKYTGEMANWLAAAGHEIRVVTAPPYFPEWRVQPGYGGWRYDWRRFPSQPKNMEVCRSPIWVPKSPSGLKRLLHLVSFALSSLPVMLWQTRWNPDLVLLVEPTFCCAPQALLAARLSGAKAWLHIQDFEVDAAFELGDLTSSRGQALALTLERWLLRMFDRVSAISGQMVGRLKMKGVDPSRCVHFPNWVDTRTIRPLPCPSSLRGELGIAENTVVALYSGSMGKKQGLDLLVDAARRLSHCSDLRFVFCGEGSYRQVFAEKSKSLQNVIMLPFQPSERLNDLLNLADIHLLPQRADAADLVMPSKLTGMLASGRPVLATAHDGTQLARAVRGLGMVVPPGDLDAFVAALVELAADKDLRLMLGQEARRYALTHLDSLMILEQFEQSLRVVCGISPGLSKGEQTQGGASEKLPRDLQANFVEPPSTLGAASTRKPCL
jgi:colanic acid biosynthesis glycosyl transferase WcaI